MIHDVVVLNGRCYCNACGLDIEAPPDWPDYQRARMGNW